MKLSTFRLLSFLPFAVSLKAKKSSFDLGVINLAFQDISTPSRSTIAKRLAAIAREVNCIGPIFPRDVADAHNTVRGRRCKF
jgi:hypothetical protein